MNNATVRANTNSFYGKNNFLVWVRGILDTLSFNSVLDVCCGNGNQLVLYCDKGIERIVGMDISRQALDDAKKRVKDHVVLRQMRMEDDWGIEKFDLISCYYGLYYSQNVKETLKQMIDHLTENGTLLIVGPYGRNNERLFRLLSASYDLPELVVRSATIFMEEEVLPVMMDNLGIVDNEIFTNKICYPTVEDFMKYWRATTFYSADHEKAVRHDVELYIGLTGEFDVEKHVLAYIGFK